MAEFQGIFAIPFCRHAVLIIEGVGGMGGGVGWGGTGVEKLCKPLVPLSSIHYN